MFELDIAMSKLILISNNLDHKFVFRLGI